MAVRFRRSDKFRECLVGLPREIQEITRQKFILFRDNPEPPYHPSLRIKPMKGYKGVWEGHVTMDYVFTFSREIDVETGDMIIMFRKIGTHDIYKNP